MAPFQACRPAIGLKHSYNYGNDKRSRVPNASVWLQPQKRASIRPISSPPHISYALSQPLLSEMSVRQPPTPAPAEDSFWLQASLHVADPLGQGRDADIEAEQRLKPAPPSASRLLPPSSIATGAASSLTQSTGFSQRLPSVSGTRTASKVAALRASLSLDRPGASSLAAQGSGSFFLSGIKTLEDAAKATGTGHGAAVNQMEELNALRQALKEATEEAQALRSIVSTERTTADGWRARAVEAGRSRDDAEQRCDQACRRLETQVAEHQAAAAELKLKLSESEREWQVKLDAAVMKATAAAKATYDQRISQLRSEVVDLTASLATVEANHRSSQDEAESSRRQVAGLLADVDAWKTRHAQSEEKWRARHDELALAQKEEITHLGDEHNSAVARLQQDHQVALTQLTDAHETKIRQLRAQLATASETHAEELRQLRLECSDMQQAMRRKLRDAESEVSTQAAVARQRFDAEKERLAAVMEADHTAALQRLIDEHCSEMSQLKARISQSQKNEDKLRRLTEQLQDERLNVASAAKEVARLNSRVAELDKHLAVAQKQLDTARADRERLVASAQSVQDRFDADLAAERARTTSYLADLNAQIEAHVAERAEEEKEWTALIDDMKLQREAVETEMNALRTQWTKERLAAMASESDSRSRIALLNQQVDAASSTNRKLTARLDALEGDLASSATEHHNKSCLVESLRAKLASAHQQLQEHDVEIQALRAMTSAATAVAATRRPSSPSPAPLPVEVISAVPAAALQEPAAKATFDRRRGASDAPLELPPVAGEPPQRKLGRKAARSAAADDAPPAVTVGDPNAQTAGMSRGGKRTSRPQAGGAPVASASLVAVPAHRVFAVSGVDGGTLKGLSARIESLANSTVASGRSNAPVADGVTHLVSGGQLTVKLLSALAKGCWLVPFKYVDDSVDAGRWLNENDYGFQHSAPPLRGKRIAVTPDFRESRHFATAALVSKDADALFLDEPIHPSEAKAANIDMLLCTPVEVSQAGACGLTWDGMVRLIFPGLAATTGGPSAAQGGAPLSTVPTRAAAGAPSMSHVALYC